MFNQFSNFTKYIGTPFEEDILPIIPAGAQLKPDSSLTAGHLGKIPGRWLSNEKVWVGFHQWQLNRARKGSLQRWEAWQKETGVAIAIGLNTRIFHAFDIDTDNVEIADFAEALIVTCCGAPLAVRLRHDNPARRVLIYEFNQHTMPIHKHVLRLRTKPKEVEEPEEKEAETHIVELLATGQQVVIEGPHAKGSMHYWRDGKGLIEAYSAGKVNRYDLGKKGEAAMLDGDKAAEAMRTLRDQADAKGIEVVKAALPTPSERRDAVPIKAPLSPHAESDLDLLKRAVQAIDLNHPRFDGYGEWLTLFRAVCAACGGNMEFFYDVVLPWLMTNPTNGQDDGEARMEAKWKSFDSSIHGAEYVYQQASLFGFTEGLAEIARRLFAASETVGADDADDAGGTGGGNNGAPTASVGSTGPTGFPDTHDAIAQALADTFAGKWRYNADDKKWYRFDGVLWQQDIAVMDDIRAYCRQLSARLRATVGGNQGAQRSRALESYGTWASIQRALQQNADMVVGEKSFDRDKHLFNTPDGVIDVETGILHEHSPELLMRHVAKVSPDYGAIGRYEEASPRFIGLLQRLANGRAWVTPAMQRILGSSLSGNRRHQHFLFIQGEKGTGKSQLLIVMLRLLGSYAKGLTDSFLIKTGGEKRFDMHTIIGKRLLIKDETQKGSTYDETRICDLTTSPVLQAEIKGGATVPFENTASLIMAGNHRPHWVSPEAGGLPDRMLLLDVNGCEKIRDTEKDIANFAERIVEEEGPAILMWLIEGAVLDHADVGAKEYKQLVAPMLDEAQNEARESSIYMRWIESERMRLHPDAEIDATEAYEMFHRWSADKQPPGRLAYRDTRSDFRSALTSLFSGQLEWRRRTTGPHKGRWMIRGLGVS
jgi:P4 family phage/plasmid primase-like protien